MSPGKQSCENCSPECKKLVGRKRIRKEVNRLTSDEKSVLNNAMKKAMTPHPDNGFSIWIGLRLHMTVLKNENDQFKLLFHTTYYIQYKPQCTPFWINLSFNKK